MKDIDKIVPWYPHYHKPPNKFLRYYEVFRERGKYSYIETIAVYLDKKGVEKEEQHFVKWIE